MFDSKEDNKGLNSMPFSCSDGGLVSAVSMSMMVLKGKVELYVSGNRGKENERKSKNVKL